ncbi:MAG: DEAD/DEAH box helicase, partial [Planctomycetota bacterium]|nr:DEAD/DEAH box helicase [Planctomycetota bacterium]
MPATGRSEDWSWFPWARPRFSLPAVRSQRTTDRQATDRQATDGQATDWQLATVSVHSNFTANTKTTMGGTAAEPMGLSAPSVATLGVPAIQTRVKSYRFSVRSTAAGSHPGSTAEVRGNGESDARVDIRQLLRRTTRTHLHPPRDVIKLHERLLYVLQPPLETLFHTDGLPLVFEPFPYQWEGIAFLATRHSAILADEMGLGKTMQAITAIRLLLNQQEIRSVLLVCPKPLVSNWQREFSRWGAEVPVVAIEGPAARRQWQWQRDDFPVKIATYETLVRDASVIQELGLKFHLVVLDEAQRIKNATSLTNRVVRDIFRDRSWALTGTPVENSVQDFIGICSFVAEGLITEAMDPAAMGHAARDLLVRRTKEQVLPQLPPKLSRDAILDLSEQQQQTYQAAEKDGVLRLSHLGHAVTIQHVLELVMRLKQICNVDPATGASCKLERIKADLEEVVASGRKVLVFSQWVETLKWLAKELGQWRPLQYHGRVARGARERVIDQFQSDPQHQILLMSYGCGGVGLNLQCAEYVFLFDRWWNPAV